MRTTSSHPYSHLLSGCVFSTLLMVVLSLITSGVKQSESARIFTIRNDCKETVWPAIIPPGFGDGGFPLKPNASVVFTAPVDWSGQIWGRTGCDFDKTGNGTCQTGNCGNALKCVSFGETPATLAEFTLASPDFYDVSLVDGYNLPVTVTPINGKGDYCGVAGCDGDLRTNCPKELAVKVGKNTVGCRSACDVFQTDQYCCKGNYGNQATCQPTYYSKKFKEACPNAYSYAYDDPTSIFTCLGTDYIITFCSSRKLTVCTYHDSLHGCNKSKGLRSVAQKWWIIIFIITLINSWFMF